MKALASSITTYFNIANSLKTSLSGQMYPHEASESATYPYGVYYIISEFHDEDFTDAHENITVQFSVFSDDHSPEEILTLSEQLKSLFDDAALAVTGYRLIRFHRESAQLIRDEERKTWSAIIDYDVILEKAK